MLGQEFKQGIYDNIKPALRPCRFYLISQQRVSMILNNNCLPWPLCSTLKAIIHAHISYYSTAVVLCFIDKFGDEPPVEIAIDVDGSMIHLITPEGRSLADGQERLVEWNKEFVANYQGGRFKTAVFPLLELEERI